MFWTVAVVLALKTVWAMSGPFRTHETWLNFVQDDFFYYLKVAQEMAAGHHSTFNGLVPTNGYHPLWFLMFLGVERLGGGLAGAGVFVAVSTWLATMATYALCVRLLRRSGVNLMLSALLAAFVAVFGMHLYQQGMEGTLATPLMLWLLCALQNTKWWTEPGKAGVWRAFLTGLLAAATVLARLDTLMFVGLLGLGIAVTPELRARLRGLQVAAAGAGLAPVAIYFAVNRTLFGTWMPVSGMAKQVKIDRGFTSLPVVSVLQERPGQLLHFLPVLAALAALPWVWGRLLRIERVIAAVTLSYMFLFIAILSYVSDWPIWYWYYYGLRPAICVAFLVLLRSPRVAYALSLKPVLILVALFVAVRTGTMKWDEQLVADIDTGMRLNQFAATHPGIYGMGDRAGAAGVLMGQPLVQTEGLMMDRAFLKKLAAQAPLRQVLAEYHVRYFVGTAFKPYTGCFRAEEPAQAGSHAAKMRAEFCEEPVARWSYGQVQTVVFDLGK